MAEIEPFTVPEKGIRSQNPNVRRMQRRPLEATLMALLSRLEREQGEPLDNLHLMFSDGDNHIGTVRFLFSMMEETLKEELRQKHPGPSYVEPAQVDPVEWEPVHGDDYLTGIMVYSHDELQALSRDLLAAVSELSSSADPAALINAFRNCKHLKAEQVRERIGIRARLGVLPYGSVDCPKRPKRPKRSADIDPTDPSTVAVFTLNALPFLDEFNRQGGGVCFHRRDNGGALPVQHEGFMVYAARRVPEPLDGEHLQTFSNSDERNPQDLACWEIVPFEGSEDDSKPEALLVKRIPAALG